MQKLKTVMKLLAERKKSSDFQIIVALLSELFRKIIAALLSNNKK